VIRAGIFIGVDKTGGLQKLNDAASGARRMYEWALAQGMVDKTNAKLITDAGGTKVDPDQIYDAIKEIIVDGAGVDQLLLYFAGLGARPSVLLRIARGDWCRIGWIKNTLLTY